MSTSTLGIPVPKLLPVTGTWTLPFATYFLLLTNRIVYDRLSNGKFWGDRLTPDGHTREKPDILNLNVRAQGNFLENIPLAFLFASIAELNGANRKILNWAMASLLLMRIVHVEVGLRGGPETTGWGRPVGYYGTQAILTGLAGWGSWLVKGYWGY